ncbi:Myosin-Va [Echinococcus granulosus]|uniref:Myosin-Va n=1 Tax=Echinococcus granulosus TaxID=6210 RepID=W6UX81_ECHGR|nr:Myosin-Va [Echinococcus granulosus]EUB63142.1 Myosin-Va [Echinococcus granulosus]
MSVQEGALLWVPQSEFTWRPATILRILSERKSATVRWLDSNEQEAVDLTTLCNKNSSLFDCGYGCIPQIDLSGLDFINEPEVLHNLRTRFCDQHEIYTYCGLLLIVLNPYEDLPIYGMEFMNAYNQNDVESETRRDPHIFAIADEALSRMKLLQQNQSIIISGESGAGKTVSARHVLKYLTAMTTTRRYRGLSLKKDTVSMPIRVLASSPLLESLGNARTTHNDNSSRFGKFLEVAFSQVGYRLVRACIKTYLLEKSRVVLQDKNERNYHIFYQLLAAVSDPRSKSSHSFLNEMALDRSTTYHYAKWEEIELGDLENFTTTLQSLQDLGFSDDEVNTVFTILAAILHLGNVTYSGISQGGSQITKLIRADLIRNYFQAVKGTRQNFKTELLHYVIHEDAGERSLQEAFQLLQCTVQSNSGGPAYDCLCFRIIHTVEGEMHKPLTVPEANSARDALAKLIYQMLFRWIVNRCNESLAACSEEPTEDNFIGILDIYGFETMEVNSFEQFCINYANEKLQQRFIKNVFQLEQEEYIREGLEWSFVEYYNNAPCIQLLEGPMGVIELLNDECKLPRPNDRNWLGRICNEHLGRSRDFSQSKFWAQERFIIQHFSEKVEYAVDGFVEKNLDRIIPEHANLLTSTKASKSKGFFEGEPENRLIHRLRISEKEKSQNMDFIPYMLHINPILRKMIENFGKTNVIGVKHQGIFTKPTVVTQFSTSLGTLMEILDRTTSHYHRSRNSPTFSHLATTLTAPQMTSHVLLLPYTPSRFCPERVMQQLRACGVLQTIRISAAGYPSRQATPLFFCRCTVRCYASTVHLGWNVVLQDAILYSWTYEDFLSRYWQLCPGNHCFEKDPVKKSEAILRNNVEDANKYRLGRTKIFFGNGVLAYLERARSARITAAMTVIQSHLRGWITRRRYQPILQQITAIQAFARRWLAQEHLHQLQEIRQKQQQKAEASEDTKFARKKGVRKFFPCQQVEFYPFQSSKTYNRALSLLRRHKTPRHSKTEVEESKGKSIEMLEREINSLRNQLKTRESEIAVKESQIAKLMKKEEQVEESKKGKRGRLNNHGKHKGSRGQSDRSFGDYEEVNYHSGGKLHRSLRKITPVGVELKIASEDATFKSGRKTEMNQRANASANLLLDLQARCSTLDAEKEELYRKLEMYQESFATAQARQHEAQSKLLFLLLKYQVSIRRLEEWIEHLNKKSSATGSCSSEAQTDVNDLANLESMIQIHHEASRAWHALPKVSTTSMRQSSGAIWYSNVVSTTLLLL